MRALILATCIGALAACDDSTGDTDAGADAGHSCTLRLSGAVTQAWSCTATGSEDFTKGTSSLVIEGTNGSLVAGSGPNPNAAYLNFSSVLGRPSFMVKSWDIPVTSAATELSMDNGEEAWAQSAKGTPSDQGSFTLEITKTGPYRSVADGRTFYSPEGSLDATLEPVPRTGAYGTVTVHISF